MATRVRRTQPRPGKTAQETRTGERPAEANSCRSHSRQADPERSGRGKLLSPSRRRKCVERVQRVLPSISERRACRVINQPRPTQRRTLKSLDDEESLTRDIIKLAVRFGRYGYRRITALLRDLGWQVNHKRVERIWRREGLKVPMCWTSARMGHISGLN